MSKKVGVVVMAALLLLYIVAVGRLAVTLLGSGDGVAIAMGAALAVLPLLAVWGLIVEVLFGVRSERLLGRLEDEGRLPAEVLPARASGRPDRAAADAAFPTYRAEVEAHPESWQSWLRLALAYDACGDRRRARHAVRRSIALSRSASDQ
ncbi:hypothetical protein OH146_13325 [Salinibacterium sp. SYSU T00001]|uniref:hypothetical protein n=1 Tax=Homoserinimonas sedimenticola TaxID=2986805 RepID=UPI0022364AA2|nr:hypothetical protein [Salinibacterium sedimenticola]MCW4386755.1 hypothetical protein [Salinibacterium sedimenticola]